ncbi:hypothetical protein ACFFSW_26510 [Saccharothrix longispora]|uniref:Uncharacterized protein n=1 Tax=Saccharothrix longispora TaxID=33920 RepID=A0ABU1PY36_9PSEU|nr:hypothetical protein [Saccharothrix longispora]MDR6595555.1 hypothetical protein [Saccharothrix longispora]
MNADLSAVEEGVARLDAVLEPIAKRPVDVDDPDWAEKMMAAPAPLDEAGVREEAEALLAEVLARYAADESSRPGLRALFRRCSSFRWAVNRAFPATAEGVRSSLLLISLRDQGSDPRDELLSLRAVCEAARDEGIALEPVLREVAAMSADEDRHGMGSTRSLLLGAAGS